MKITFLDFDDIKNPLLGAGQAKATLEVGKRLARKGHSVTVICSKYPGYKNRHENGIEYKHIGIGTKAIRLNNIFYILILPFYVKKLRCDIIVECFTAPISTLCSQLFTKIPVVGLPTSFEADRFSSLYKIPFWIVERLGLNTYNYFLPYTKYLDDKMKKYNNHVISKIVPEGVEKVFFSYKRRAPQHILFLGRFDIGQKGIDLLLKAYAQSKNDIKLPLVLAGYGPDEDKIKKFIKEHALENKVTIVGPAFGQKKRELLEHAQFVAFPSRHEGFSLFSLEVLASGLPLIGFNIPGLSWATSDVALKAERFDVDQYADLMKKLMNPSLAHSMGKKARKFATKFTWERVADEFENFFIKIINNIQLI